jgi:hypothetical protein
MLSLLAAVAGDVLAREIRQIAAGLWAVVMITNQEDSAVFAIDTIECLGGGLPKPQERLVEAWVEIHRAELEHDWALLQSGQPPVKIAPLR